MIVMIIFSRSCFDGPSADTQTSQPVGYHANIGEQWDKTTGGLLPQKGLTSPIMQVSQSSDTSK